MRRNILSSFVLLAVFAGSIFLASCGSNGNLPCVSEGETGNGTISIKNDSGMPMVVKVGRATCKPCIVMTDTVNEIGKELEGKIQVAIVDIDEDPEAVEKFQIQGIPTTFVFDTSGNQTFRKTGIATKDELVSELKKAGMQ